MLRWKTRVGTALLCLTLLTAAQAAPVDRSGLWRGVNGSPGVTLAQQQLELARVRLNAVQGWQVSATGNASASRSAASEAVSSDLTVGLRVVRPGPAAQDDTRLALVQGLRRAESEVQRARLAEWRSRAGAWNELAGAQAGLDTAALASQAARLGEQAALGRASQGAATALQVQAAGLDRQRAELTQAQAQVRLTRARAELAALDVPAPALAGPGALAAGWTALPLPPAGFQGQRSDVLEAELAAEQAAASLGQARRDALASLSARGQYAQGRLSVSGSVDRDLSSEVTTGLSLGRGGLPATWSLGLSASINLDGHAAKVVQASERSLALARTTLSRTRERAARLAGAGAEAVQAARQNLDLAAASLAVQQQAGAVAETRQAQGLTGEPELAQARVETQKAVQSLVEARRQLDLATLDLWEAVGWVPGDVNP